MTKRMTDEELMEARDRSRERANDRWMNRMDREDRIREQREAEALHLVGELQGEKGHQFYINVRSKNGLLTGAIREFPIKQQAVDHLLRNNYV